MFHVCLQVTQLVLGKPKFQVLTLLPLSVLLEHSLIGNSSLFHDGSSLPPVWEHSFLEVLVGFFLVLDLLLQELLLHCLEVGEMGECLRKKGVGMEFLSYLLVDLRLFHLSVVNFKSSKCFLKGSFQRMVSACSEFVKPMELLTPNLQSPLLDLHLFLLSQFPSKDSYKPPLFKSIKRCFHPLTSAKYPSFPPGNSWRWVDVHFQGVDCFDLQEVGSQLQGGGVRTELLFGESTVRFQLEKRPFES